MKYFLVPEQILNLAENDPEIYQRHSRIQLAAFPLKKAENNFHFPVS